MLRMNKKSNKWISLNLDPSSSNDSIKIKKNTNIKSKAKLDFNFLDKLQPKRVEDLAVHPKKVKEVLLWLEQNVGGKEIGPSILLLTGPTGAGKTATVNVLCKSLNVTVREWVNPMDQNVDDTYSESQLSRFMEFFSLGKYNSLYAESSSKRVLLVEDFPNFLTRNPEQFADILQCVWVLRNVTVVFICTDASNGKLDFSQSLFTNEIRTKYQVANINFNPVSATLIKTALKQAQALIQTQSESYRIPSTDVIDAIVVSAMGDVRSATNQFMFACLKDVNSMPLVYNKSSSKKRKRGEKSGAVKFMEKDEILGFFHSLGRVLNPKHDENSSMKMHYDFDSLIDQFATQPSNCNAFLQENYLKYFGNLNDVQLSANVLSAAQLFLENWSERQEVMLYALWVAVLGLMVYNKHKVSKWNQITGLTKVKKGNYRSQDNFYLKETDYFYYNIITNSEKFHRFKF
ncbi:hypothetical protein FQA39_LY03081 [Lamprigera yunnana]|nr:hypothetical protein FQA39_LY03081 [Lamprigera yunnana]